MKTITLLLSLLSFSCFSQQVLTRVNTAGTTNKSFQIYRQNSPGNVFGNSYVLFEANYDSIYINANNLRIDILDGRKSILPAKKFITANNNGLLTQGNFDSLSFSMNQISGLSTALSNRPDYTQGALIYKPIGYTPTYMEVISALSYVPLRSVDTIGGSGTGAIMTTTSANASLNQKVSKSSTITINGNTQNFTSNPSFSNVGIEIPTQSGQSGKVLSTNGTTVSWINTPAVNYTAGTGISIAGNVISNTAPDQTVTITGGNRISVTGTYPNFTISYIEPSINVVSSKTLNSNFTVSATKQAIVSYSVTCTVTNPLLAGSSTANVFLEYSTNGGTIWQSPSQNGNSSSVGVAVAVAITNGQTVTLIGAIPANALVRLRTTTTGTASVVYVTGTEIY